MINLAWYVVRTRETCSPNDSSPTTTPLTLRRCRAQLIGRRKDNGDFPCSITSISGPSEIFFAEFSSIFKLQPCFFHTRRSCGRGCADNSRIATLAACWSQMIPDALLFDLHFAMHISNGLLGAASAKCHEPTVLTNDFCHTQHRVLVVDLLPFGAALGFCAVEVNIYSYPNLQAHRL